jgi:hypothetical protein
MGERVLICGGRNYRDRKTLYARLDVLLEELGGKIDAVIVGGAAGADSLGYDWACDRRFSDIIERYPANWTKYGKSAGPIRNQQMLDDGKPTLVVAFPGGRGTADMVARARRAGVKVMVANP